MQPVCLTIQEKHSKITSKQTPNYRSWNQQNDNTQLKNLEIKILVTHAKQWQARRDKDASDTKQHFILLGPVSHPFKFCSFKITTPSRIIIWVHEDINFNHQTLQN